MNNVLLNLNKETLKTLERALNFYLDNAVWSERKELWTDRMLNPNAYPKFGEEMEALINESRRVNLLQKQVGYQKRLLKID